MNPRTWKPSLLSWVNKYLFTPCTHDCMNRTHIQIDTCTKNYTIVRLKHTGDRNTQSKFAFSRKGIFCLYFPFSRKGIFCVTFFLTKGNYLPIYNYSFPRKEINFPLDFDEAGWVRHREADPHSQRP